MTEHIGLPGTEEELVPIVWEAYMKWNKNRFPPNERQKRTQQEQLETITGPLVVLPGE